MRKGCAIRRSAEEADRIYARPTKLCIIMHALECVEALDKPELLTDLYQRMGIVHIHRGSHTQAIENLQRALKLASSKDKRAELNVQIGEVYTTLADERSVPICKQLWMSWTRSARPISKAPRPDPFRAFSPLPHRVGSGRRILSRPCNWPSR
jgi:hypothetical protein